MNTNRSRPYEILALGNYSSKQIAVRWVERGRRHAEEVERLIELAWQQRMARSTGKLLFPGALVRLNGFSSLDDGLILELGPTDYRELIGTNVSHPEIAEAYGIDYLSNALAVHATVATKDGKILLFQRSSVVGEYPGAYDMCGGHVDPAADAVAGVPDPFATLIRELEEEIGLVKTSIEGVVCRGLVRNCATFKPDMIFDVCTTVAYADFKRVRLDEEHRAMLYVRDSSVDIARFVRTHWTSMAPAGIAALELHARG